jgi:hypothetical protein
VAQVVRVDDERVQPGLVNGYPDVFSHAMIIIATHQTMQEHAMPNLASVPVRLKRCTEG